MMGFGESMSAARARQYSDEAPSYEREGTRLAPVIDMTQRMGAAAMIDLGDLHPSEVAASLRTPVNLNMPLVATDENWVGSALCAQTDPVMFRTPNQKLQSFARRVCHTCEVFDQCLADAMSKDVGGIRAATDMRERNRMKTDSFVIDTKPGHRRLTQRP